MKKTKLFWLFGNLNRHPFFADDDEDTGGGNASDTGDEKDEDAQDDGKKSAYERNLTDIQDEFDRQIEESGDDDEVADDQDSKEDKDKNKSQQQDLEIDDDEEDSDGDDTQDDDGDDHSADDKDGQDNDDNKSAISAELVQRAIRLGFDQDELSGFKSDATLSRVLDAMESRASGNQSTDGDAKDGKQDDDVFKLELGDDYTDDFKEKMQKMNEFYASKLKSVRDELSSARQELNRIQGMEYVREFDASIKNLGDPWQDVFGKGSGQKLDPKGSHYKNRVKLDEEMSIIALGRKQMGKPPLNRAELFQRALQSAFSDKIKSIETAHLQKALKDRSRRSASRPTHRNTKPMTADEELLAIQTEFDRKMAEDGSD
ncbi:MAG TPA: hypothetical protein PKB02_02405 [Anaerohalosphaeraceae bacterium]|nr:hypothetical protein [Anaerohalosphaeraceae bacterium]